MRRRNLRLDRDGGGGGRAALFGMGRPKVHFAALERKAALTARLMVRVSNEQKTRIKEVAARLEVARVRAAIEARAKTTGFARWIIYASKRREKRMARRVDKQGFPNWNASLAPRARLGGERWNSVGIAVSPAAARLGGTASLFAAPASGF